MMQAWYKGSSFVSIKKDILAPIFVFLFEYCVLTLCVSCSNSVKTNYCRQIKIILTNRVNVNWMRNLIKRRCLSAHKRSNITHKKLWVFTFYHLLEVQLPCMDVCEHNVHSADMFILGTLTTWGIRTLRNWLSIRRWHVRQHSRVLTRRALAVTWETKRNKAIATVVQNTPNQIFNEDVQKKGKNNVRGLKWESGERQKVALILFDENNATGQLLGDHRGHR